MVAGYHHFRKPPYSFEIYGICVLIGILKFCFLTTVVPNQGAGVHLGSSIWWKGSKWVQSWKAANAVSTPNHGLPFQWNWIGTSFWCHSSILGQCHFRWRNICKCWIKAQDTNRFLWRCGPAHHQSSLWKAFMFLDEHCYLETAVYPVFPVSYLVMWSLITLQETNSQHHTALGGMEFQCPLSWHLPASSSRESPIGASWDWSSWYLDNTSETSVPGSRN